MHYPQIDPIIVSLGPVALRWYGLMYLLGFAAVWWLGHKRRQLSILTGVTTSCQTWCFMAPWVLCSVSYWLCVL